MPIYAKYMQIYANMRICKYMKNAYTRDYFTWVVTSVLHSSDKIKKIVKYKSLIGLSKYVKIFTSFKMNQKYLHPLKQINYWLTKINLKTNAKTKELQIKQCAAMKAGQS